MSKRIYYFDVLRAVACISVVLLHASGPFVGGDFTKFDFWFGDLINSLARLAVPAFIMLSGALYLDENKKFSVSDIAPHAKKMLWIFLFWSLVYTTFQYVAIPLLQHKPFEVGKAVLYFLEGSYHFWYIWMLIGMYFIIPLLKLWVKRENKKWVEYAIVLGMVFGFLLPQIVKIGMEFLPEVFESADYILSQMAVSYISVFVCYFLLGWYLHNFDVNEKLVYTLGFAGLAVTFFGTGLLSLVQGRLISFLSVMDTNVMLYGVMAFVFVKKHFSGEGRFSKVISVIAKHSLAVYIIHFLVITIVSVVLDRLAIVSSLIRIPVVFAFAFSLPIAISAVMKKIPVLKRLI